MKKYSESELEAYLDEALAPAEMARIEAELRRRPELTRQLSSINGRRDAGIHSLAGIWRRHRLSCPTREQLGSYLLGAMSPEHAQYITFHVERIGCRLCRANLEDLRARQSEAANTITDRRKKFFQSSAGYLRK